jgi:hypothetical protein
VVRLPLKILGSLCLILSLSSCGLTSLPFFGGGGGPTVNSNAQIGKENTQQVVAQQTTQDAGRDIITETKEVEAKSIEDLTIKNTNIPVWVMVLLLLGWLLPTPTQMGQGIYTLLTLPFKNRKTDGFQTK